MTRHPYEPEGHVSAGPVNQNAPEPSMVQTIEQRLREGLHPQALTVQDDSHRHAGHAGAASGGGHYLVRIVSPAFSGKNRIARHRLVYDALGGLFPASIHALALEALAPEEAR